jgi:polyphosphate kinase
MVTQETFQAGHEKKTPQTLLPPELTPSSSSNINPADSQWYLNRELTWLAFKRRVLHEAEDERVPLLERLKFVATVSGNMDEFFMKRIGGLKQQIGAGMSELTLDGRTPRQQVQECYSFVRDLEACKAEILSRIIQLLRPKGIKIERYNDLSIVEKKQVSKYYHDNIFPLLTPQSIDPAHPFPFISNLSLNLLVTLRHPKTRKTILSRVKVPVGLGTPRFIKIGAEDHFVSLEDIMMNNLEMLFPGVPIETCELFRVTRNANTESNEDEADDLMAMIESELKDRKFAPIVRLEVESGMSPVHRGKLANELKLNEGCDVFEAPTMLAMRDLSEFNNLDYSRLHYPPHHPIDHHLLQNPSNIFHIIRDAGAFLLQHPYESFATSVERFLREAAADPKVRGIKMTLYRTSINSCIIDSLVQAANNGKQVAVVIELKARFDEAANIRLAERMEEAGIHVTFGVVGLITYCKVILIVRQDYSGLRRYVHIGTGNYHADKAREFSDIGMLTCDNAIGQDVTELFNYLTTGFSVKRHYSKLIVAPISLKKAILKKIEQETALHAANGNGHIRFKMNALEDTDVVEALYKASMAGVRIELIIRDTCRLRPGIKGLSENISVTSIVGRFMEHSRIYYFRNNGQDDYYIGSADLMKRNLEARVEILVPVEAQELKQELYTILDIHSSDQRLAWEMRPDGTYVQRTPSNVRDCVGSHQKLIDFAEQRSKAVIKGKSIWIN